MDVDATKFHNVARKFGFRTISKTRWEALKQEYLDYRANLIQEMSSLPELNAPPPPPQRTPTPVPQTENDNSIFIPQVNEYSHFPPNCLVYVQNVHTGTSKTALKTLFSNILDNGFGIDYVDYNKGMQTVCSNIRPPLSCTDSPLVPSPFDRAALRFAASIVIELPSYDPGEWVRRCGEAICGHRGLYQG
ncbi:hypothetical protein CYLTODRAFT_255447 [Cylindrobasidium torrendii FP15055 ss-10]|uniref:La-related protein 7 homolog xRRM domain-containing protein n=1 Tax=Cylindrobasidium torrendii FP15055 ss-10 TaxID=1314674 RepID=A0A0D7BS09_9AGAR|nr:hypothetical protein CYLTODRAFT_255447 [Cylindrobasidium torrendii FP15055 ss-10]